jgi:hypothetical protein
MTIAAATNFSLAGLTDKLYWRPVSAWKWHCFKKCAGGFVSLCHEATRERSGGQGIGRPPSPLRCGRCSGLELQRRGWDEEPDESKDWRTFQCPVTR